MDTHNPPNFSVCQIGDSGKPGIKQGFNNLVYKIKRAVTIAAFIALALDIVLVVNQSDEVFFAITHRDEIKTLGKLDPQVRQEMFDSALRLEKELKNQREEKVKQYFPGSEDTDKEDKGKEVSVSAPVLNLASTAKASTKTGKVMKVTAYNPLPEQTDATPCLAEPTKLDICELAKKGEKNGLRICASNDFPLYQVVAIEYLKGGTCVVLDRMASIDAKTGKKRNENGIDVFYNEKDPKNANIFGVQYRTVTPVGMTDLGKLTAKYIDVK